VSRYPVVQPDQRAARSPTPYLHGASVRPWLRGRRGGLRRRGAAQHHAVQTAKLKKGQRPANSRFSMGYDLPAPGAVVARGRRVICRRRWQRRGHSGLQRWCIINSGETHRAEQRWISLDAPDAVDFFGLIGAGPSSSVSLPLHARSPMPTAAFQRFASIMSIACSGSGRCSKPRPGVVRIMLDPRSGPR
jgi:hypothetical protein